MTRDTTASRNKIALLATGDEIINGDILNTNSQIIAQKLFNQGMHIGMHMAAADNLREIEQAILFLLKSHRALIITGGLGPTSDDLTRHALSKALHRSLVFDEATWKAICDRFKQLGYTDAPPESNRQQALFPEGATIIPNPNGTAAGSLIQQDDSIIFMLPGPPPECLPMVDTLVLNHLKQSGFQEVLYYDHWLLFGVSEGKIAEELDALAKPFDCTTGYRLAYPYLEFKVHSNNQQHFYQFISLLEKIIAPYLLNDRKQMASTLLREKLETLPFTLTISDCATGGLLESILRSPRTHSLLRFSSLKKDEASYFIEIRGLTEFWEEKNSPHTQLYMIYTNKNLTREMNIQIPLLGRSHRVKQYAIEYICQQIYNLLTTNDTN